MLDAHLLSPEMMEYANARARTQHLKNVSFRVQDFLANKLPFPEQSFDLDQFSPEFDHLTLLIHQLSSADWLADVGFGDSFLLPLRIEPELEQDGGDGRVYRLQRTDDEGDGKTKREYWIVQQLSDGQWNPHYRFTLQPHELTDFVERCHYQQTSPESHFTQKRICSLATPTGRVSLSDLRLITTVHQQRKERMLASEEEYLEALVAHFGIVLGDIHPVEKR